MQQITAEELQQIINSNEAPFLILDVRERWEYNICHIQGSKLVPMSVLEEEYTEIPQDKLIICLCHHGIRSLNAAHFLLTKGYKTVANLQGGIDLWIKNVDQSLKNY